LAMDPRVKTPAADLAKQFELGLKIWEALQGDGLPPGKRAGLAHLAGIVDSGDRAPSAQAGRALGRARAGEIAAFWPI